MVSPEFKAFSKIERFGKLDFHISQKIHGTNAHILIYPDENGELQLLCGSRTRWIYPHDDNYGFATFVHANREEFIQKLGVGRHDGEWAGAGINSGEGLSQKTFVLFDHWKWPEGRPLPPQTVVVPILYKGPVDLSLIDKAMEDLKTNGSKLAPGFMRPEGIVVQLAGVRYKKVFDAEETQWTKGSWIKNVNPKTFVDFSYLCQPIRLEKLLSKDERYTVGYPQTLPEIVKEYMSDLIDESQIVGTEDEMKSIRKAASSQLFIFIKHTMENF